MMLLESSLAFPPTPGIWLLPLGYVVSDFCRPDYHLVILEANLDPSMEYPDIICSGPETNWNRHLLQQDAASNRGQRLDLFR